MRLYYAPLLLVFWFFTALNIVFTQSPVAAALPRPTAAQMAWHQTEFYLFCHFGPNTFTDLEWGAGTEPEDLFQPGHLDCDQWCRLAVQAGARGIVITAKHHDGFCLWPSKYSTHTVRESPWRQGKGDVIRELADACRRHGLKFGVYLSPWDRHHPLYGTAAYNDVYANMLTELMTSYGDLFEVWWDGANGEGPNGKRQVYDFHRFERLAAQLQPQAVIFSDIGPGCRWVGNERGLIETETNWCTLDTAGFQRGLGAPPNDTLNQGNVNGALWIPAECDVSIRPGWFYHPEQDGQVKTPAQLFDIYQHSVGRGANLILNVPPDRDGRFSPADSTALVGLGNLLREKFAQNLAKNKKIKPVQTGRPMMRSRYWRWLTDGNPSTFASLGFAETGAPLEINLGKSQLINAVLLQEFLPDGQRVQAFKVEVWENKAWREVARSTTIGAKKILTFPTVTTGKVRISILAAKAAPRLSEVQVFLF